jgi:hypothetical protein
VGVEGSYSKNISLDLHVQKRKSVVEIFFKILLNFKSVLQYEKIGETIKQVEIQFLFHLLVKKKSLTER